MPIRILAIAVRWLLRLVGARIRGDDPDGFIAWSEEHDTPRGKVYWLIAELLAILIVLAVIGLVILYFWFDWRWR